MSAFYQWIAGLAERGLLPADFQYPFLIRGFICVLVLLTVFLGVVLSQVTWQAILIPLTMTAMILTIAYNPQFALLM